MPRGTANLLPAIGVGAASLALGAASVGLALGEIAGQEVGGAAGPLLESLRSLGVGWAPLAATALAGLGVAVCLRGLATLERRVRLHMSALPDPTALLEDIDLSQQNLHLGFAGLEKSVGRAVTKLLTPLQVQIEELGAVASGLSEQAEHGDHALEVRLSAVESNVAAALAGLRSDLQAGNELQREQLGSAVEARLCDLEQRLSTQMEGLRDELGSNVARELETGHARLSQELDEHLSRAIANIAPAPVAPAPVAPAPVEAAPAAPEPVANGAAEPPAAVELPPTAEMPRSPRPLSEIEQVTATLESASRPDFSAPEPNVEPDAVEAAEATELLETVEPELDTASQTHQPMLEPEVARALAETGFHRVSSLGLFDSLDEEGEVSRTDTRSGIEVQESSIQLDVDELPPLRSSTERATEGLRLHEDPA